MGSGILSTRRLQIRYRSNVLRRFKSDKRIGLHKLRAPVLCVSNRKAKVDGDKFYTGTPMKIKFVQARTGLYVPQQSIISVRSRLRL